MIIEPDNAEQTKVYTMKTVDLVRRLVQPEATFAYWYNEHAMNGTYDIRFTVQPAQKRSSFGRSLWYKNEFYVLKLTFEEILKAMQVDESDRRDAKFIKIKRTGKKMDSSDDTLAVTLNFKNRVLYNGEAKQVDISRKVNVPAPPRDRYDAHDYL